MWPIKILGLPNITLRKPLGAVTAYNSVKKTQKKIKTLKA